MLDMFEIDEHFQNIHKLWQYIEFTSRNDRKVFSLSRDANFNGTAVFGSRAIHFENSNKHWYRLSTND